MRKYFLLFFIANTFLTNAQKQITLEDIWQKGTFRVRGVPGFNFLNDGVSYSATEGGTIYRMNLKTGQVSGKIYEGTTDIEDYSFSNDESKILLATDAEQIYRRSSKAFYKIWNGVTLTNLFDNSKQSNPSFNPQASHVAFTSENNMYVKDLAKNDVRQITKDGAKNRIINGFCDWVYEEEFSFTKAYEWSPDGSKIAFLRFDETNVPQFTMQLYRNEAYPIAETFKYPKVGENNSIVTVWLYDVKKKKLKQVPTGGAYYVPRLKWTPDNRLVVFSMNRHQNDLTYLLFDKDLKATTLYKEANKYYIDLELNDDLTFLKDGSFIKTGEQDGWNHIYHYDATGKLIRQITKGAWEVRKIYGYDAKRNLIYYQASKLLPREKQVYGIKLDGSEEVPISVFRGVNDVVFNTNFDYYIVTHSTINQPPQYAVYYNYEGGQRIRILEENTEAEAKLKEYGCGRIEFIDFTTTEGVNIKGWMLMPPNLEMSKKYPVLITQYSGPGSQQVIDQWGGANYWWYQMLAQKGYIVACFDPRGTGGRGENFKKMTYKQLGHYETIDQIEAGRFLASRPLVDPARIGIFGWSYGGYMSSLCVLKGNDVFKAAIAVAPVTNWKWYDTVYTERYMQTDKENPDGYKNNSPVNFADRLKGNYLLIHGMADDNVHFQNAVEMVNALVNANKQFDTYYYPNRNHGIYGGYARLHLYTKMTDFLLNKL